MLVLGFFAHMHITNRRTQLYMISLPISLKINRLYTLLLYEITLWKYCNIGSKRGWQLYLSRPLSLTQRGATS